MPRTTTEATRFTSTTPHISSKSPLGINATTIPVSSSPTPADETPQQKVKRLREAARRAKLSQESSWDKVVLRGRVWADRAHRVTATGLIFASVVATSFALLSLGDMVLANRSKKAAWFTSQQEAYERALAQARDAERNGTLTADLALFLNKERAIEMAEREKAERGSLFERTKRRLFGGLKFEESSNTVISTQGSGMEERPPAGGGAGVAVNADAEPSHIPFQTTGPRGSRAETTSSVVSSPEPGQGQGQGQGQGKEGKGRSIWGWLGGR